MSMDMTVDMVARASVAEQARANSTTKKEFGRVTVFGLGYIGLPTAAVIASRGMHVRGIDINEEVVHKISLGKIHIYEPDLDGLVQKMVSTGSLTASTRPEPSDAFIIAVPTPIDDDKVPVLDHVFMAARTMAPVLEPGNLVILESTSPVGTTEGISEMLADLRPDLSFPTRAGSSATINVAYCPERVLPGRILSELVQNDRCIGGISPACSRRAQRFYKSFVRGACIASTARTAELVKLTENAFRDANIAFANELSKICDRLDVNVWDVIDLANRHPRVNVLRPGPGVGGHCIAVDPWFIVHSAPDLAKLIHTARTTNDHMIDYTVEKASALIAEHPYADVACLGLAFKANVDDVRESPALEVATRLGLRFGSRIKVVDPYLNELPAKVAATGAEFVGLADALAACEIAVVLVDHDEFRSVPLGERRHLAVLDTRGIWRDFEGLRLK